jgi:hypothetical protein
MLQLLTAIRSLLVAGVTIEMKLRKKKPIKSISTPTFNHNQDPDGKDGSLLGDHGRAEAKDLPTTRRMQNKIQKDDPSDRNMGTLLKAKRKRTKPLKGRDQDQWTISIPHDDTKPTSSTEQYKGTEVSLATAYLKKKTILDPNSITMCSLRAPEIIRDTMSPGSVSVDGSEQFNRTSNCQP